MKELCFIDASPSVITVDIELILKIQPLTLSSMTRVFCRWHIKKCISTNFSTMLSSTEGGKDALLHSCCRQLLTSKGLKTNFSAFVEQEEFQVFEEHGEKPVL